MQDIWNTIKHPNMHFLGVTEDMEKYNGLELFSEIIAEHLPNLENDMDIKVQEAVRNHNRQDQKSSSLQHIIIKLSKIKHQRSYTVQERNARLPLKDIQLEWQLISKQKLFGLGENGET